MPRFGGAFSLMTGLTAGILVCTVWSPSRAQSPASIADSIGLPLVSRKIFPFCTEGHMELRTPKVGLVLSGGGARGFAQIGVLKALEEAGIPISFIVGTSVGSIVGGLYAAGYSIPQLEKAIVDVDWSAILRFTDQVERDELLFEKRSLTDQSIFSLRLDGLSPILPRAVSNGQRLNNLLNGVVLQAIYRPKASFDDLRIPFRAVCTDLYSGKRVVLDRGNLAEAMRASSTVPVFYAAVDRDSMAMVDGGLISNIPVDVARDFGCDYIIAVNTTSDFRSPDQIANPLQTLDQVFNVMMAQPNAAQLTLAQTVITPDLNGFSSFDFQDHDTLIARGYRAALQAMPGIRRAFLDRQNALSPPALRDDDAIRLTNGAEPGSDTREEAQETISSRALYRRLVDLFASGAYEELCATRDPGASVPLYTIHGRKRRTIDAVELRGNDLVPSEVLMPLLLAYRDHPCSNRMLRRLTEDLLRSYRDRGYSFASIDSIWYDQSSRTLGLLVDEGRIGHISIVGNTRTSPVVILREFPLSPGDIFQYEKAKSGLENITGLALFHQVTLDIDYASPRPDLIIRVEERSSQLLRFGIRLDDERNAQFIVDLRDENLFGSGSDLGLAFQGGAQNRLYKLQYNSNRLFWTNFLITARAYWGYRDMNVYGDKPDMPADRFERINLGTYRRTTYGASVSGGTYLERFGNLTVGLRGEQQAIRMIRSDLPLAESQRIIAFQFGTNIDSKDRFPFTRSGLQLSGLYESALKSLGSELSFARLSVQYDFYASPTDVLTIHPRVQFGYGDKTLPLAEQFSLGGQESFFGMRENEFAGRQIFRSSLEVRCKLPIQIVFDSYLSVRYDLGSTWEVPEEIQFKDLRHGVGATLSLDTPLGPAEFSAGQSFLFLRGLTQTTVATSPVMIYFSFGAGI